MFSPVWSPDSQQLAFIEQQSSGSSIWNIWIMNANGSSATVLTTTNVPDPGNLNARNLA